MRRLVRMASVGAAAVAALSAVLLSCSSPTVQVLLGNYRQSKGEYPRATVNYFRAVESGRHQAVIRYDLGNVYRSLGEVEAAAEVLVAAFEEGKRRELRFRSAFNLGCISFQENDFHAAVSHFSEALRIDPNDWDAKVNLELSLAKLPGGSEVPEAVEQPRPQPLEDSFREVLDIVRKREELIWQSVNVEEAASDGRDW